MKAFISYSHQDHAMLDYLHKHLVQLRRDQLLDDWTDRKITAGGAFEEHIFRALERSQLFIALLSPDYLASSYCYEKEFQSALQLQEQNSLIIVPIIVEPCDWQNTPFSQFKALPKDGKPISTWESKHTAFLDVTQNIRNLLTSPSDSRPIEATLPPSNVPRSRNYRVKKDFDSIDKLDFTETTFHEVKESLKRHIEEIKQIDNIKTKIIEDKEKTFECKLVNRNKINSDSHLRLSIGSDGNHMGFPRSSEYTISYSIGNNSHPTTKQFSLSYDEFQMYWSVATFYTSNRGGEKIDAKAVANIIWEELLNSVGIL